MTKIHRQGDAFLINILQKLRIRELLLPKEKEILLNHKSNTEGAIKLFATRAEVKRINDWEFKQLPDIARTCDCIDNFEERDTGFESKNERVADGTLVALVRYSSCKISNL